LLIGDIASEPVHNSYEALAYLHNRWPTDQGHYFQAAKFVCRQSINGTATAELAREAFISAAIEADIVT
jgi:hypothetical protein